LSADHTRADRSARDRAPRAGGIADKPQPIAECDRPPVNDDYQLGRMVRDVRMARSLRQQDVAERAGVSRETISRLERGLVDGITVGHLRAISRSMGMPSIADLGWRSPEVERIRDKQHASLVEAVACTLTASGWIVIPEYTFSFYGERGSVDDLAWHPLRRVLLIGEIKTRIWDLQDTLSTLDRKKRLVPELLRRERNWRAESVGVVLVMLEKSTNRHLIQRHSATFDAALPDRQVRVRRWLEEPDGGLRGILFLPISRQTDMGQKTRPRERLAGPQSDR
jgi:transcriptional regulator with XRE-family HTH domain